MVIESTLSRGYGNGEVARHDEKRERRWFVNGSVQLQVGSTIGWSQHRKCNPMGRLVATAMEKII